MLSREFVKEVIKLAAVSYVTGNARRETIHAEQQQGKAKDLGKLKLVPLKQLSTNYPRYHEAAFGPYDANTIPGTQYVASQGPRAHILESFITNVILNDELPVRRIVALGSCLAYSNTTYRQDFLDYCVKSGKLDFGIYQVKVNAPNANYSCSLSGHQLWPKSIIESTLEITSPNKKTVSVKVTLIPLRDNDSLEFERKVPAHETTLPTWQAMWNIFKSVSTERTLVHCASGVGRTGHLILMFEILKNYNIIFSDNDPAKCAIRIHKVLTRIRQHRPCLLNTEEQFSRAIMNACELYNYAITKKRTLAPYILPLVPENVAEHNKPEEIAKPVETAEQAYAKLFNGLSIDPDANKNPMHRAAAYNAFNEELQKTDCPIKIQALLATAKPYINRHTNPRLDGKLGKLDTHTWEVCIRLARARGLQLAKQIASQKDIRESIQYLEDIKGLALFSQHRSRFFIFGAFGNTTAQNTIKGWLNLLRDSEQRLGNSQPG